MSKNINLYSMKGQFTKKLQVNSYIDDSEESVKFECTIGFSMENNNPEIHIGDTDEVFEDEDNYKISLLEICKIIAENYVTGNYMNDNKNLSYKRMASTLRHYADIMEIEAEEQVLLTKEEAKDE